MRPPGEEDHLYAKEREASEKTTPAGTLTLDLEPPEPCGNIFPLSEPRSLWYFVTAALVI